MENHKVYEHESKEDDEALINFTEMINKNQFTIKLNRKDYNFKEERRRISKTLRSKKCKLCRSEEDAHIFSEQRNGDRIPICSELEHSVNQVSFDTIAIVIKKKLECVNKIKTFAIKYQIMAQ